MKTFDDESIEKLIDCHMFPQVARLPTGIKFLNILNNLSWIIFRLLLSKSIRDCFNQINRKVHYSPLVEIIFQNLNYRSEIGFDMTSLVLVNCTVPSNTVLTRGYLETSNLILLII